MRDIENSDEEIEKGQVQIKTISSKVKKLKTDEQENGKLKIIFLDDIKSLANNLYFRKKH